MHLLLSTLLIGLITWASCSDIRERRIANWLTLGGATVGLLVRGAMGGSAAFLVGAEGWLVGLAILLIPFALSWMGAGDVKLLAALGALGGTSFVLYAALFGTAIGGVFALGALLRQATLGQALKRLGLWISNPITGGLQTAPRIPLAPALAGGALGALVLGGLA